MEVLDQDLEPLGLEDFRNLRGEEAGERERESLGLGGLEIKTGSVSMSWVCVVDEGTEAGVGRLDDEEMGVVSEDGTDSSKACATEEEEIGRRLTGRGIRLLIMS